MSDSVERWGIFELVLEGPSEGNPFLDISLRARFRYKNRILELEGFYDGAGTYKIRFSPDEPGEWTYETISSHPAMDGQRGGFTCTAASKDNHGPVKVRDSHHFAYADGTPHFSVGTTCYAWIHQPMALVEQTLQTLAESPFNKIRMCVFPKDYAYNKNEPTLYPFERTATLEIDTTRFSTLFFQHLERQVAALRDLGIEADLIIFHPYDRWGHSTMDAETDDRYIRYLAARLAAYRNVWWSMANEFDFMKEKSMADWDRFFRVLTEADPYGRLKGIHNGAVRYDHSKPWITHVSVQTADMYSGKKMRQDFRKPVIFDEVCYEGDIPHMWGNISARELVHRFWSGTVVGCYVGHGETYEHSDDILWWSKGGVLHGESASRLAFLRSILESGPGRGLDPLSEEWSLWNKLAGVEGEFYLVYFGVHQPARMSLHMLPDEVPFKAEIIDPWAMTIEPINGVFHKDEELTLPAKPYMAVRLIKEV